MPENPTTTAELSMAIDLVDGTTHQARITFVVERNPIQWEITEIATLTEELPPRALTEKSYKDVDNAIAEWIDENP